MKNNLKLALGILLLSSLFLSCTDKPENTWDLGIEGGQLLLLESGELIQANIYISHGIIDTITQEKLPARELIMANGKYVLPGFWDNHVHFRGGDSLITENKSYLDWFLINGITTVRDAGGDLAKQVIGWRDSVKQGQLDGPSIFTAGPKLDGPNATWAGSLVVNSTETLQLAMDSLDQLGVDFVKLYDSRISRDSYLESLKVAEIKGYVSSGHMPFTVNLEEAVDAGIDAIEHLYYVLKGCSEQEELITRQVQEQELGFWGSMDQLMATYSSERMEQTSKMLIRNNTYVVPTLHIGQTLSYLDQVDHSEDSWLKLISPTMRATYQGRIDRSLNASKESRDERKALDGVFRDLTAQLYRQGVPLLAGSDSGAYNSYVYPGWSLHQELENLVAIGLTPLDALRTSSMNGARFMRVDDEVGLIRQGLAADLVILNRNPLQDITYTRKIDLVVKGGKAYDPSIMAQSIGCPECVE